MGMLDLKAKLASAGLVSAEDVERVENQQNQAKRAKKAKARGSKSAKGKDRGRAKPGPRLPVDKLRDQPKSEVYTVIRERVEEIRFDAAGRIPAEDAKAFHFGRASGKIGKLMIDDAITKAIQGGDAAVVAFMSNHGLDHAVVPVAFARDLAELFPLWLRVLDGDPRAGKLERDEASG